MKRELTAWILAVLLGLLGRQASESLHHTEAGFWLWVAIFVVLSPICVCAVATKRFVLLALVPNLTMYAAELAGKPLRLVLDAPFLFALYFVLISSLPFTIGLYFRTRALERTFVGPE